MCFEVKRKHEKLNLHYMWMIIIHTYSETGSENTACQESELVIQNFDSESF